MRNVPPAPLDERTSFEHDPGKERRTRERFKVCLPVHIRPSSPSHQQIKDITTTLDLNRHGLCFTTSRDHYHVGMPLSLTFPYSSSTSVCKEFLGEVVRVDDLPNANRAVAVRLVSPPAAVPEIADAAFCRPS
ncbi:MAG: hypothetical protein DMG31_07285 [Acidobacteria bacterium]|nr:MAG: hypothetical protein DMG31_07285 [Acidobacteriota bacterium]